MVGWVGDGVGLVELSWEELGLGMWGRSSGEGLHLVVTIKPLTCLLYTYQYNLYEDWPIMLLHNLMSVPIPL